MLHIASSLQENLRGARTRPRVAFKHACALFEHARDLLSITPIPCSNIPLLRFQPHLHSVVKPARRRVYAAERPRTAPGHSLRTYRSYAPRAAKRPRPAKWPRAAKRPRATPSPSPRAGSLSNSDAWKSLKLRAASLHDYKLSVLGSSWGFP